METLRHTQFEIKNNIGYIYLNRPEVHNAIDPVMIDELSSLFNEINRDPKIYLAVIRGKGKSFSSGADLNYMSSQIRSTRSENLEDAVRLATLFDIIYNCSVPVISVVHGNVTGGAIGLIAVSDLTICASNTTFRFTELKLGLIPSTIAPYIIRRIGEILAAELFYTSRKFSGDQAFSYGLVNRSVKIEELDSTLNSYIDEFLTAGPNALKNTKLLIRAVTGKEIDPEVRRFTSRLIADVRNSSEAQEGMKAFLEKRNPEWSK